MRKMSRIRGVINNSALFSAFTLIISETTEEIYFSMIAMEKKKTKKSRSMARKPNTM